MSEAQIVGRGSVSMALAGPSVLVWVLQVSRWVDCSTNLDHATEEWHQVPCEVGVVVVVQV